MSVAAACALAVVSSPARADDFDPLRPSASYGWTRPQESSSLRFREYMEELPNLVIRTPSTIRLPPKSTVESKVISWEWPHTRVMFGMHVRRTGANDRMVGALTAADTLAFTQQGVMLAGRAGVERGWFRLYGLGGAGGLQLVSYDLGTRESDLFGTQPKVKWSGLFSMGIGAEIQLSKRMSVGTEYDVAILTATPGREVMWPDPRQVIRSWYTGIKLVY
jgi:hypothetical protein